jgi:hypothetical protein
LVAHICGNFGAHCHRPRFPGIEELDEWGEGECRRWAESQTYGEQGELCPPKSACAFRVPEGLGFASQVRDLTEANAALRKVTGHFSAMYPSCPRDLYISMAGVRAPLD